MPRLFKRTPGLREEMVLDRTFELVNLRECLRFLRQNKIQSAVDIMEMRLDSAVVSIARHLAGCKASTKGVIECELKKTLQYREESARRTGSDLDGCESTTRERLLSERAEAEKVLSNYKRPGA